MCVVSCARIYFAAFSNAVFGVCATALNWFNHLGDGLTSAELSEKVRYADGFMGEWSLAVTAECGRQELESAGAGSGGPSGSGSGAGSPGGSMGGGGNRNGGGDWLYTKGSLGSASFSFPGTDPGWTNPKPSVGKVGGKPTGRNIRGSKPNNKTNSPSLGPVGGSATTKGQDTCVVKRKYDGPIHHIASDKDKLFAPQFQTLFDQAGLSLQSVWNRMRVPGHVGPHGKFYNGYILERLRAAVSGKTGGAYRSALIGELKVIRREIRYGDLGDLLKAVAPRVDVRGIFQ